MRCDPGIRLAIAAAVCIGAPVLLAQTPQSPPAPQPVQQAPPTTAKPPQPAATTGRPSRPAAAADARLGLTLMVTASDGRTLPGVAVRASGPVEREAETDPSGLVTFANMSAGTYRLRFDHKEFVPFEKEVTLAPGRAPRLNVTLTSAPPPPPAPKPEPVAPPPPPAPDGSYSPSTTSIPDFVESNYIGGAPVKRSPVGCGPQSTSTLVQTKDPVAEHTHADADETIYVVAGEGMHRVAGRETAVSAGSFAVVPRGTPHSLTRRGSRPLIFVSTLAGPPCQAGK
jgi:mannose-6-phosphate isomerase-like protein (cupin superfamily)